jgi:hypothetical protein
MRFFDETIRPPVTEESCEKLAPPQQRCSVAEVVLELEKIVSSTAKQWALGSHAHSEAAEAYLR